MDTNTKEVIEQFGTKLDSYVQVLAEKLGVAAEYVYPLFVKQQVIEGIWFFSLLGLIFGLSLGAIIYGNAIGKRKEWKDGWYFGPLFSGYIALFVIILVLVGCGSENFGKITNPEYSAIKEIVQMVK